MSVSKSAPAALVVLALVMGACGASPTPSAATPSPTARPSSTPSPSSSPSAGPELPLSLAFPPRRSTQIVRITVTPDLPADGSGSVVVRLTNLSDTILREPVLRWPTDLAKIVTLAPFKPTRARIEGTFSPLFQEWTKWVVGPGESGEPAGTTSVAWGPLLPGTTLVIPLVATRYAAGPVSFDFQVLSYESILTLESGESAELRVELP